MAHQPDTHVDALPANETPLVIASTAPRDSIWAQPRGVDDAYVDIGRRELPALTSLRFFAAMYVVVHHLINIALLYTQGADADRAATWYLAWGTQGYVGVTFFFVLSGFILAWCYHRSFGTATGEARTHATRRFWRARFARVWPLHAAMFAAFLPLAVLDAGTSIQALFTTAWQGTLNVLLLHAWWPFGGPEGLADTFNAPSWTLSVEALFYLLFPAIAALLVHRLRWGVAQLGLLAVGAWFLLGVLGMLLADADRGEWIMRVLPATRLVDFVVGVTLGLAVVQRLQRAHRHARPALPAPSVPATSMRWTLLEAAALAAASASPLVWALAASEVLPDTLGTSWFHLPTIAAAIVVTSLERGAISRHLLAWRPIVWLGEISYALYLVHLFLMLAAYRAGLYDVVGPWAASVLLVAVSIAVSGVIHERFEKPVRARLIATRTR